MMSVPRTGYLLRTLAASKPAGTFLELGTGTGVGTAWLLDGMDSNARLISVDHDPVLMAVARRYLAGDPRLTLQTDDAAAWIGAVPEASFDLIFADTWAGKFTHLEETLRALKSGGLYVVDDMFPLPDWSDDHRRRVEKLLADLEGRPYLRLTEISWSSGIILAAKRG
jgi:predicted O-methyltransferase YrrM